MQEPDALYSLVQFASFFEAMLGINLAYSWFHQVKAAGYNLFVKQKELHLAKFRKLALEPGKLITIDNNPRIDRELFDNLLASWNADEVPSRSFSDLVAKVATVVAFIAAITSLTLLFLIGLTPDYPVLTFNEIVCLAGALGLPVPVVSIWMWLYWRRKLGKMTGQFQILEDVAKLSRPTAS